MTKKDFFVIIESDNLYLDLAPCSGYKEKAKTQKDGTQFIKSF